MWLDVNGMRRQNGSTKTMIFKPAFLVSYLSQFMSLHPGDVITTGTPPGVGMGIKPEPIFLNVGDVMELGIEKLGQPAAGRRRGVEMGTSRFACAALNRNVPLFRHQLHRATCAIIARRRIPRALFDYIDRGSYDERHVGAESRRPARDCSCASA